MTGTIFGELAESLDASKLVEVARQSPISWSQRLGYLLELVDREDLATALMPLVHEQAKSFAPLRRAAPVASAQRSAKWKLIVNVEVELDA